VFLAGALALLPARFAAEALLLLADLPSAAAIGLGLARRDGIDAFAHHFDRQGDDVDRGRSDLTDDASAQEEEKRKKDERRAHDATMSMNALPITEREARRRGK
jgi:hypothetical protein